MNPIAVIKADIVKWCNDDFVDLWSVREAVYRSYPSYNDESIRELTLSVVKELLEEKAVVVVDIKEGYDFRYNSRTPYEWKLSPDQAVERIRTEWSALGRNLIPWEIAIFDCQ